MTKKVVLSGLVLFLGIMAFDGIASQRNCRAGEKEDVLAVGEGLTLTRKETDILRQRLSSYFRTTDTEYCRALLKMKLFAKEARAEKLDQTPEIKITLEQIVLQELSELYIKKLLSTYPLKHEVIESYYLSHIEEFKDKEGKPVFLDDKVEAYIREKIMKLKKAELVVDAFNRLKKKYEVKILDSTCLKKKETQ